MRLTLYRTIWGFSLPEESNIRTLDDNVNTLESNPIPFFFAQFCPCNYDHGRCNAFCIII